MPLISIILTINLVLYSSLAAAQEKTDFDARQNQLQQIEKNLYTEKERKQALEKQKKNARRNITILNQKLAKSGKNIQYIEGQIDQLEKDISVLHEEKIEKTKKLQENHLQLGQIMIPLLYLSEDLPFLTTTLSDNPMKIAQGYSIMQSIIPPLKTQADTISVSLTELAEIQKNLTQKQNKLLDQKEDFVVEFSQIETLSQQKQALYEKLAGQSQDSKRQIESLTAKAQNLRELIAHLNDNLSDIRANRPNYIRDFPKKGGLNKPAEGKILTRFRQKNDNGTKSRGIFLQTTKQAHITALFDGLVVFAGSFGRHKKILIIEHKDDYHTVLSGIDTLYVTIGQWLIAGEPIGRMAKNETRLYVELRRKGQPLNPTQWIDFNNKKRVSL